MKRILIIILIREDNNLFGSDISRTDVLLQGTTIVNWNFLSEVFTLAVWQESKEMGNDHY